MATDTHDIDTDQVTRRGPGRPPRVKEAAPDPAAEKVRIVIPKTKEQIRDVFVRVNDTAYLLQRGVPVEVPRFVAMALENAVQTEYEEFIDPVTGRKDLRPQQTMSVPFQYV